MVILLAGSSYTGKTFLSQKLLEKYSYPYLSIDHLKMGLIRSGQTRLTAEDDELLKDYLWPIVREIVKTAIENNQNLIIEGCYIPFNWKAAFTCEYLRYIKYYCLIMTSDYITNRFSDIIKYANAIETRINEPHITTEIMIKENEANLEFCKKYEYDYILINSSFNDLVIP